MTPEQSKTLKPGARVCFNGDESDGGAVKATNAKYVTIKWNDGHESFTGHRSMARVDLAAPVAANGRN
jgi:hypothetical protein